ncbi:MAG: radical SAM protein [Chlamydiota bacterium]
MPDARGTAAGEKGGVLLVNIPYSHAGAASPPLGLACVAAALDRSGTRVGLLDAHALRMDEETIVSHIRDFAPDAVGFSVMSSMFAAASRLTRALSSLPSRPLVIWGGAHPTVRPEESLERGGADLVVLGEGEMTAVELAPHLRGGPEAWRRISGLAFEAGGKVELTPPRPLVEDLDSLPFPAYHLLPIDRYATLHTGTKRAINILTSRGCPGKCTFCSRRIFGRTVRFRSVGRVLDEISMLISDYRIEEICIIDDAFTEDRERVLRFCREIRGRGLSFPWRLSNGARVDRIDDELLRAMRTAGCYEIAFGVESGDDEVLRKIGKEITTAQIAAAFAAAKRAGLDTIGFFMIGHPFDTVETMRKTVDLAIRLDPTYAQFTMATPLPGTALWDWVERHGTSLFGGDVARLDFLGGAAHFETAQITRGDVEAMYRLAYRRFYFRPRYLWKKFRSLRSWSDVVVGIRGLGFLRRI